MSFVKRLSPLVTVKRKTNTDKVPTGLLGTNAVSTNMLQNGAVTLEKLSFDIGGYVGSFTNRIPSVVTSGTEGQAVYFNGTSYVPCIADDLSTSKFSGILVLNTFTNQLDLVTSGVVSGYTGLVAGTIFYLSQSNAGEITDVRPFTGIVRPIGIAISNSEIQIIQPITQNISNESSIIRKAPMADVGLGKAVYYNSSTNAFELADNTSFALSRVVGLSLLNELGVATDILLSGIIELSGLSVGSTYFLDASGEITDTSPSSGFAVEIGKAITETKLLVDIKYLGIYSAGTGPTTINWNNGDVQSCSVTANITTFSNGVSGKIYTLITTTNGTQYSFPSSVTPSTSSSSLPNGSVVVYQFLCESPSVYRNISYGEPTTFFSAGTGPTTINWNNGSTQSLTLTANITSFNNGVAGRLYTLLVTSNGTSYTLPTSLVNWDGIVPQSGATFTLLILCIDSSTYRILNTPYITSNEYDYVVGTSSQVTNGLATHSSLQSAITQAAANSKILILKGYSLSENVTLNKTMNIDGEGRTSAITGNLTLGADCDFSIIRDIRVTGNVVFSAGSSFNFLRDSWVGGTVTDSGTSNSVLVIQA
jgi:hypothetical protein